MNIAAALEVIPQDKAVDAERLERWCIDYISRTLNIPANEIHPDDEFYSFGLDSAVATAMIVDLEEWLGIDVPPSAIFEQVTIGKLVTDLMSKLAAAGR